MANRIWGGLDFLSRRAGNHLQHDAEEPAAQHLLQPGEPQAVEWCGGQARRSASLVQTLGAPVACSSSGGGGSSSGGRCGDDSAAPEDSSRPRQDAGQQQHQQQRPPSASSARSAGINGGSNGAGGHGQGTAAQQQQQQQQQSAAPWAAPGTARVAAPPERAAAAAASVAAAAAQAAGLTQAPAAPFDGGAAPVTPDHAAQPGDQQGLSQEGHGSLAGRATLAELGVGAARPLAGALLAGPAQQSDEVRQPEQAAGEQPPPEPESRPPPPPEPLAASAFGQLQPPRGAGGSQRPAALAASGGPARADASQLPGGGERGQGQGLVAGGSEAGVAAAAPYADELQDLVGQLQREVGLTGQQAASAASLLQRFATAAAGAAVPASAAFHPLTPGGPWPSACVPLLPGQGGLFLDVGGGGGGASGLPGSGHSSCAANCLQFVSGSSAADAAGGLMGAPEHMYASDGLDAPGTAQVAVHNVPFKWCNADLEALFSHLPGYLDAQLLFHENGRSKGVGVALFADAAAANEVCSQLSGAQADGRKLELVLMSPDNHISFGCKQVAVLGLPWEYTAADVRALIEAAAEADGQTPAGAGVEAVEVAYREDGKSEGRAIATFRTRQQAHAAIMRLHGRETLAGLRMRLFYLHESQQRQQMLGYAAAAAAAAGGRPGLPAPVPAPLLSHLPALDPTAAPFTPCGDPGRLLPPQGSGLSASSEGAGVGGGEATAARPLADPGAAAGAGGAGAAGVVSEESGTSTRSSFDKDQGPVILHVSGLMESVSREQLRELFSQAGEVTKVDIPDGGRSMGYGFITFSNPQAAEQAMLLFNNYPLGGGAIHVAYSTSATAKARQQALRQARKATLGAHACTAAATGAGTAGTAQRGGAGGAAAAVRAAAAPLGGVATSAAALGMLLPGAGGQGGGLHADEPFVPLGSIEPLRGAAPLRHSFDHPGYVSPALQQRGRAAGAAGTPAAAAGVGGFGPPPVLGAAFAGAGMPGRGRSSSFSGLPGVTPQQLHQLQVLQAAGGVPSTTAALSPMGLDHLQLLASMGAAGDGGFAAAGGPPTPQAGGPFGLPPGTPPGVGMGGFDSGSLFGTSSLGGGGGGGSRGAGHSGSMLGPGPAGLLGALGGTPGHPPPGYFGGGVPGTPGHMAMFGGGGGGGVPFGPALVPPALGHPALPAGASPAGPLAAAGALGSHGGGGLGASMGSGEHDASGALQQLQQQQQGASCKVVVTGLPVGLDEAQVMQLFQICGPVVAISKPANNDVGIVTYESLEGSSKAVSILDGTHMPSGGTLSVQFAGNRLPEEPLAHARQAAAAAAPAGAGGGGGGAFGPTFGLFGSGGLTGGLGRGEQGAGGGGSWEPLRGKGGDGAAQPFGILGSPWGGAGRSGQFGGGPSAAQQLWPGGAEAQDLFRPPGAGAPWGAPGGFEPSPVAGRPPVPTLLSGAAGLGAAGALGGGLFGGGQQGWAATAPGGVRAASPLCAASPPVDEGGSGGGAAPAARPPVYMGSPVPPAAEPGFHGGGQLFGRQPSRTAAAAGAGGAFGFSAEGGDGGGGGSAGSSQSSAGAAADSLDAHVQQLGRPPSRDGAQPDARAAPVGARGSWGSGLSAAAAAAADEGLAGPGAGMDHGGAH